MSNDAETNQNETTEQKSQVEVLSHEENEEQQEKEQKYPNLFIQNEYWEYVPKAFRDFDLDDQPVFLLKNLNDNEYAQIMDCQYKIRRGNGKEAGGESHSAGVSDMLIDLSLTKATVMAFQLGVIGWRNFRTDFKSKGGTEILFSKDAKQKLHVSLKVELGRAIQDALRFNEEQLENLD